MDGLISFTECHQKESSCGDPLFDQVLSSENLNAAWTAKREALYEARLTAEPERSEV
jgi:hypothetical protein